MTRKERVEVAIERGNVAGLLAIAEPGPCACLGARDGEPECVCRMNINQVCEAVSYAALKRGKLVRLPRKDTENETP